ncbi:hypothetical protein P7K49_024830 [Saguinus oedipus]|uniref:Uncharacterized protein n=1 Tax=Saguinus oedipus TaxID=9490 RepID=A0ABQ9UQL5_SAGOE|nr:hypothetical protein P7K49_024830 [Saguinus oedipus]
MAQAAQLHSRPRLSLCPTALPSAPPPVHMAWALPEFTSLVLGSLLGIISLFLGTKWCHRRAACRGCGMSGHLTSEGIYEDIGAFPMEQKDEGPAVSGDLGLEETYDDAGEPEDGAGEEAEEAGVLLSPAGVHLCALASMVLFLLYCSYAEGSDQASAYI